MQTRSLLRRLAAAGSLIVALLVLPGGGCVPPTDELPPAGDVNGDGVLDQSDLDEVAALFGLSAGDEGFVSEADLDDDGTIGLSDLQLVARLLDEQQQAGG